MPRIGNIAARELAPLDSIAALEMALGRAAQDDASFLHLREQHVAQTPDGLRRGHNLFGPGHSAELTRTPSSISRMREIASVVLNEAMLVPSSMSILDRQHRLFFESVENLGDPMKLAGFDPHYGLNAQGELAMPDAVLREVEHIDCVALPVCGLGVHNYGHFLYDGLPGVHFHAAMFEGLNIRVVGPKLADWQRAILASLGLLARYLEIERPVVFRKILATTMLSLHVSYPTSFIRSSFEAIRFATPAPSGPMNRGIYLSRAGDTSRRVLRNRAEVEREVARLGFDVVRTETMTFRQQVDLFRSARIVVGESGAAMANLGFCDPGVRVLEIQPERFTEGWTRGMCFLLAHRWNVYFARVDSPTQTDEAGQPRDPNQFFAYDIDPQDLGQAIASVVNNA